MSHRDRVFIPRPDRRLGDRYELLECLGDGSYGWVWRASRLEDDRVVAVKIPKAQGACNEDLAEGAALVGQPEHPNVVSVYWMGRVPPEREWYAIEMEYFPSVTLAQMLDRAEEGLVTTYDAVLNVYGQVLAGMAHLHGLGTSHGDVKPQNVLVSAGQAKLTDFGSSIRSEEMYARVRENGGTILYSAPEIVASRAQHWDFDVLRRADVYSLGVLLYHLLTSRLPHDTFSQVARHVPFPRPREVNSSICPALEAFTLRCLEGEPGGRWPSVAEMIPVFEQARLSQRSHVPPLTRPAARPAAEDWSSRATGLIGRGENAQAQAVAAREYQARADPHAFLLAATAASRDGRHFDCLRLIEEHPEMLDAEGPVGREVVHLAIRSYLETRQLHQAERLIDRALKAEESNPNLWLKKASVLGMQARYGEAGEILLRLNREHPGRPGVLRRLVVVFEQQRDLGKAMAFLRAYLRELPEDSWGMQKQAQFAGLGAL
jgi:serine/threonine-protein kinase